jgi:hypothetical protein
MTARCSGEDDGTGLDIWPTSAFRIFCFRFPYAGFSLANRMSWSVSSPTTSLTENGVPVSDLGPPGFRTASVVMVRHLKKTEKLLHTCDAKMSKVLRRHFNTGSKLTVSRFNPLNNISEDRSGETNGTDFRISTMTSETSAYSEYTIRPTILFQSWITVSELPPKFIQQSTVELLRFRNEVVQKLGGDSLKFATLSARFLDALGFRPLPGLCVFQKRQCVLVHDA